MREGGTEGGRCIRTHINTHIRMDICIASIPYSSPTHALETDQCFHSYSNKVICMNGNTQIAT